MKAESNKPKRPAWKILGFTLIGCLLSFLVVAMILDSVGASELSKAVREARAIPGPLSFEECVRARPHWPPERNAAEVILALKGPLSFRKIRSRPDLLCAAFFARTVSSSTACASTQETTAEPCKPDREAIVRTSATPYWNRPRETHHPCRKPKAREAGGS